MEDLEDVVNCVVLSSYYVHSPCCVSHLQPTAALRGAYGVNSTFANEKTEAQRKYLLRYNNQVVTATGCTIPPNVRAGRISSDFSIQPYYCPAQDREVERSEAKLGFRI